MELPSRLIEAAVDQVSSLPGIGKKTALRLVLNLLARSDEQVEAFAGALLKMKEGIHACSECHNLTEDPTCSICENSSRSSQLVCVVEDIRDLLAMESTGQFSGKYHVLGGVISPMDGIGPNDLNIETLVERLKRNTQELPETEVIFALPATMEGETTAFYLFRKLSDLPLKITAIARGLSVGEDLQHADEATLIQSLKQRIPYTH